jgi:[ribosomal protein S5]-alanine N-acetyltransferase
MPAVKKHETKKEAETLSEMLKTFGNTLGEILDDPKVKETAKKFAASLVDAAAKVAESKVKAEDIRGKFRNVGKAAQTFGTSLDKHFKSAEEA